MGGCGGSTLDDARPASNKYVQICAHCSALRTSSLRKKLDYCIVPWEITLEDTIWYYLVEVCHG